jgi:hypothetical protein
LIPQSIAYSDHKQNNSDDEIVIFKIVSIRNSLLCPLRENFKSINYLTNSKNDHVELNNKPGMDYTFADILSNNNPFDYRKSIRQGIPLYFNGSKYKNNYLVG